MTWGGYGNFCFEASPEIMKCKYTGMFKRYKRIITAACIAVMSVSTAWGYTDDAGDESPYIPEILIVESDEEAAELESKGVIIWRRRADMALAAVPRSLYESAMLRERGVSQLKRPRRAVPTMDIARTYYDASLIHTGQGLPSAYTGKGVVVGFCDIAFDPNHINFKDENGKSRVKRLVYYDEPNGIRKVLDSEAEIAAWTTDYDGAYHGTHVAGIMTGSYNANGYGGMAPGAEIVATTSQLYDAGILSACEDIIEYAKSVGKPAVINLSVGSYNGPHDGTTLFNRYMSLLGEEAVICMAAGNEGIKNNTYRVTFGESTPAWRTAIEGNDWVHFNIYGLTDAWSNDERPVSARFIVYDTDTRTCVYESDVIDFTESDMATLSSESDTELAKYMTATVQFYGGVNELNGRWATEILYETESTATAANSDGRWARYRPGLEFSGAPGVHADITADGQYSTFLQAAGYPSPNSSLSVSDIATGDNIVVVGMYNNRTRIPTLSGTDRVFDHEPLTINIGSGYGTLIDGRMLPHSVAPGGGIVSSSNRYYTIAHPEFIPRMNAVEVIDGETYYWGSDAGTSMATPYLAGVVATWIEAVPTLKVGDVLATLEATNMRDCPDPLNPRHGHGWLQPYEGLKYVLKHSGVTPGIVDESDVRIVPANGKVDILNPSGKELRVSVISLAGFEALPTAVTSDTVSTMDLAQLPAGVYVVSVYSSTGKPVSVKIVR